MKDIEPTAFAAALRNQFWLIRRGRKRTFVVFAVLALCVLLAAAFAVRVPVLHGQDAESGGVNMKFEWFSEKDFGMTDAPGLVAVFLGFLVILAAGFFWPFVFWGGEPPRARTYHWLMPIARWKHDLARVLAGGGFLAVAIAVVFVCLVAGLLIGGRSGALDAVSAYARLSFVTAPLTAYLLTSTAALLSDRPGRVVFLVWLAMSVPYVIFGLANVEPLYRIFHAVAGGPFSYASALYGGFLSSVSQQPGAMGGAAWFTTAVIWLSVGLAGVFIGLRRRRES